MVNLRSIPSWCCNKPLCLVQAFNEQSLAFQEKIMERSGLGDDTYLPDGMLVLDVIRQAACSFTHARKYPTIILHLNSNLQQILATL